MESNKDKKTDDLVPPGMLSSPHIAYCVNKYKIISNYDASCLDSASYQMRVGGSVLTWDLGEKIEFELGENEDKNRNIRKSVVLKPNSLTFLTTIEEFRLTKDIIARFNLKSKWVHQGLLLGTGPIVDPQLHARLLIPVHNFSSQPVTMDYGKKFISVEFTKTLDPDDELILTNGEKAKYIENVNWLFDFHGYRERIGNRRVESSVQNQFEQSKEQIELSTKTIAEFRKETAANIDDFGKKTETTISRQRNFNYVGFFAVLVAIGSLIIATWNLIESTHTKADAAYNLVKQYKESGVDFRSFSLKSDFDDLRKEFVELKRNSERGSKSDLNTAELKAQREKDVEEMKLLGNRIKVLEDRLKEQPRMVDKK